jgi:hypothetical protein
MSRASNTNPEFSQDRSTSLTVTFSEDAKGWVCFKSFIQDNGLSLNNDYYTIKDGRLWKHHDNETRNNFYNIQEQSFVDILFNEESEKVKSFASMKYEGSQAKITQNLTDGEYYNNIAKDGWYVQFGITDLQASGKMEFKDKEGKWFSYMKGFPVKDKTDLNSEEFSFQGIDELESIVDNDNGGNGSVDVYGCTDRSAINFDPLVTIDDGSCIVCSTLSIDYTITAHAMANLSNGIKVLLHNTGDDLPYTVACLDSQGTTIGDSSGAYGWSSGGTTSQGNIVYFGQGTPLITDTYTIIITTVHGCTSQDTIFLDNSAPPPPPPPPSPSTFVITVQDIEDNDPVTNI